MCAKYCVWYMHCSVHYITSVWDVTWRGSLGLLEYYKFLLKFGRDDSSKPQPTWNGAISFVEIAPIIEWSYCVCIANVSCDMLLRPILLPTKKTCIMTFWHYSGRTDIVYQSHLSLPIFWWASYTRLPTIEEVTITTNPSGQCGGTL